MTGAAATNEEIRRRLARRGDGPFTPAPLNASARQRILDQLYRLADHAVAHAGRAHVTDQTRWVLIDSGTVIALGDDHVELDTLLDQALAHGQAEVVVDLHAPPEACALRVGRDEHGDLSVDPDEPGEDPADLI